MIGLQRLFEMAESVGCRTKRFFLVSSIALLLVAFLQLPAVAQEEEAPAPLPETEEGRAEAASPDIVGITPLPGEENGEIPLPKIEEDQVALPLRSTVLLALKNNLNIAFEAYNPQIFETDVGIQESEYDTIFSAEFNKNREVRQVANALTGSDSSPTLFQESFQLDANVQKKFTPGTSAQLNLNAGDAETGLPFAGLVPEYSGRLTLSLTQPLLKDFGIETGTSQIRIANINVDASENQFRNRVDDIILQVVNNYWELVFQIAQIKAIEDALGLAEDLLRETEIRIEVGTLAPIEVYQSLAEVAQRKEALIVARDTRKDIEDQLRLSLNLYDKEEYWMVTIVPADQPLSPPVRPDLTESIRTALERRPDLLQAKLDIEARNINVKYTKNQTLPTVDLFGSVGTTGMRGRPADSQFFGVDSRPSPWSGHWDDVTDDLFNGDYYNYTIGIKIEFPWENRFAKSAYSRAKVEKARSLTALKDLEINIITQVKEAVRQLATDLERIEAAKATLTFNREKLGAEKKKYEVGLSTTHDVLEFQEDLARSQADLARALSNYEESLAAHARVKGVLLEAAGLRM